MRYPTLPIAVLIAFLALSGARAQAADRGLWSAPVEGDVARPFSYSRNAPFRTGGHRGLDLTAAAGSRLRAACSGRVAHAGAVAGVRSISVLCGDRRVSYLPLEVVDVSRGEEVRAGAVLGTVARGHSGSLHLGVRRTGNAFAYEDPQRLLGGERPGVPVTAAPHSRRRRHDAPSGRRVPLRRRVPRSVPEGRGVPAGVPLRRRDRHGVSEGRGVPAGVPLRRRDRHGVSEGRGMPRSSAGPRLPAPANPSSTAVAPATARSPTAPWPIWLGLGLLLAGIAGSRPVVARRGRRRGARDVVRAPRGAARIE